MKEYFYETYRKLGIAEDQIDADWESFVTDMELLQSEQNRVYNKIIEYFNEKKEDQKQLLQDSVKI